MKELIENVVQWGRDKGLDKVGHLAQAKYTLKETAELLDAYADQDIAKINDAIGDIAVTLIVGASNNGKILNALHEELCLDKYKEVVVSTTEKLDDSLSLLVENVNNILIKKNNPRKNDYIKCIIQLQRTRVYMNEKTDYYLSLKDCLQLAYDEIKDRTGKLVDGQFIKD